jgi:hypothetical protein
MHGIKEEIEEDLVELVRVAGNINVVAKFPVYSDSSSVKFAFEKLEDTFDDPRDFKRA